MRSVNPEIFGGGGLRSSLVPLVAVAALALAGFLALGAGSARADTVGFSFDEGVINLGGPDGTWAPIVDPALDPPDKPATINAEVAADGSLTAAASDFFFPSKRIEGLDTGNPILPVVDANIAIAADGPITGNFDQGTGEASIVLPADVVITVYSAGSPASVARCRVDGFDLNLKTTGQASDPGNPAADPPRAPAEYEAGPFAPPAGEGAMLASWTSLPNAKIVSGSLASVVCPGLDDMLGGPGAIWLSGKTGGAADVPAPVAIPAVTSAPDASTADTSATFVFEKGEDEGSPVAGFECSLDGAAFADCSSGTQTYTGLAVGDHTFAVRAFNQTGAGPEATYAWTVTAPEVCPPGTTGTPPECVKPPAGKAKLANLKIKPKNRVLKRGKKVVIKVRVRNAGKAAAKGVKVCVNVPKRLVKVKRCVKLRQIKAGKGKVAKFKVKAKRRKGKAVLKFKATSRNAGKKVGRARVRIK